MGEADACGAENQRIYVDAIDEAFQRSTRNGKAPRGPRLAKRRLNDIAVRQMRIVEKQQRILAKALKQPKSDRCDKCGRRGEVSADAIPALVSSSNEVTNQIEKLARSIRDGHKAEREAMGGLTNDELDEVLRAQLPRMAASLKDDDRRVLLVTWFGEEVTAVLMPVKEAA